MLKLLGKKCLWNVAEGSKSYLNSCGPICRLEHLAIYNKFFAHGIFCPKFYGFQKLSEQGIPLRPIIACTKSPTFNIYSLT